MYILAIKSICNQTFVPTVVHKQIKRSKSDIYSIKKFYAASTCICFCYFKAMFNTYISLSLQGQGATWSVWGNNLFMLPHYSRYTVYLIFMSSFALLLCRFLFFDFSIDKYMYMYQQIVFCIDDYLQVYSMYINCISFLFYVDTVQSLEFMVAQFS